MARPRDPHVETLDAALKRRTREGVLYEKLDGNKVRCFACGHRCVILDGHDGICRVRFNRGGTLFVPRGYVAGLQVDPIEKKPFFHAFPGAVALSFGMLGCDFHCGYCQNWLTSQALRDDAAIAPPRDIEPAEIVDIAKTHGAPVIVTTYNEPLITSEWAVEVFSLAKEAGIICGYVSNGNGTPECLKYIRPYVDLYKVDLKSFRDAEYRQLGGKLENVLRSIELLHEMGFWVEIVTLVVPGFNDSEEELRDMAKFLAGVSVDIPWHLTAFHQDYKMTENRNTAVGDLVRAAEIGKEAGLRYVYAGNLPGMVGDLENTRCWKCRALLIERWGYKILSYRLDDARGACPDCGAAIAGFWRKGWKVPEKDGGLPGRRPRALPLAAEPLFSPPRGTNKEPKA
jgi:pyruvate formate lyase activating enzyme